MAYRYSLGMRGRETRVALLNKPTCQDRKHMLPMHTKKVASYPVTSELFSAADTWPLQPVARP